MTMQRYDRNSVVGLTMTTVNPCNNFIIDYLIRTKIKSDKQVSSKYYMYNLAIQSVRKYPLPLICQEQLAALEGFGNFFINRVAKLMKRHYLRGRMPTEAQMEIDDRDHLQGIRQNLKRLNLAKKQKEQQQNRQKGEYDNKINQDESRSENDSQSAQNSDANVYQQKIGSNSQQQVGRRKNKGSVKSEETLKFERIMYQNLQKQLNEQNKNQKSEKSFKSQRSNKTEKQQLSQKTGRRKNGSGSVVKKRINYRPRKNTEPYQVLKAIIKLQKPGNKAVLKGDINQYFYNLKKQKMKGWTPVRQRLVEFGYITSSPLNQDEVQLTVKGRQYVYQMENKQDQSSESSKSNDQKQKKIKKNKYFKEPIRSRSRTSSDSQSKSFSQSVSIQKDDKRKQKFKQKQKQRPRKSHSSYSYRSSHSASSRDKLRQYQKIKYKSQNPLKKQPLIVGNLYKEPTIIVNQKSEINLKQEQRMLQLLSQNKSMKYVLQQLQFGDFSWVIEDKLLDILVIRIKSENFDAEQFFLICRRARYSQCDNIYFVFEETLIKGVDNKKNLINNIFADSRVAGFKMVKTAGLAQTICFITKITADLAKKIKSLSQFGQVKPISFLGTPKQFNEHIRIFKPLLARNVGISCLRCIPNISREMIKKIIKKMPGLWYIYNKLRKLRSDSERKRFLLWYLQEMKPKKGMIRLIVDLLFFQDYDV